MKTICTLFCAILFTTTSNAQCYNVTQVNYEYDSLSSANILMLSEDQYSGKIPIGFSFCFYGASYDTLLVGSNAVLSFNTSQAGGYCPWPIAAAIPNPSLNPLNAILFCWQDLHPSAGGVISYQMTGISPNRIFVVDFDSVPNYSCTNLFFSGQVKLIETSNVIEIYLEQKGMCTTWNGGYAIEGVQNSIGTSSAVVPGRNYPTQWTAANDAWTFTPICNVCSGVGIAETQTTELNLYVSDQNQITILLNDQNYKLLSIYNTLGQEMKFTKSENTISLSETAPGIYILNFEINGIRVAKKLILN